MAYTKLFASIITSTIWIANDQTRIVWITMLALADKNGEVQGSVPGLARIAGVSMEACEAALKAFLSPDEHSRTKTDEGRRIEEIDGGWHLLNHEKYRKMASKEDAVEKNAERQRRHRARNASVTARDAAITQDRDIAEADTEEEAKEERKKEPPTPTGSPPQGGEKPKDKPDEKLGADQGKKLEPDAGGGEGGQAGGKPRRASTGKTALPRDWQANEDQRAYAAEQGNADVDRTILEFCEFYWSSGAKWLDWNLVFKRWCRNQKTYGAKKNGAVTESWNDKRLRENMEALERSKEFERKYQ